MPRKKLIWQLFPLIFLVSVVSILAASWYAASAFREFYLKRTSAELEARANLAVFPIARAVAAKDSQIEALCTALGLRSGTRITVVDPEGRVLADSSEQPERMENHAGRPEIREALSGRVGSAVRYSSTLQRHMMYVAIPVQDEGRVVFVLRTALPLYSVESALRPARAHWLAGVLLLVVVAGLAALAISRWLTRPVARMKDAAERFAAGDLDTRMPVPESEELGELAEVLNGLAHQLGEKIALLEGQRNEQAAVFSSMVEGVVAVDNNERIINLNQAAANLLGVSVVEARNRSLQEAIRNTDLQRLVTRSFASAEPIEGDIVLHNGQERYLQAHAVKLRDARGGGVGTLVVLNDVTRLRKLENVRRDFVANVSHELKTPITSIKGFVETLQDGAINNPEDAGKFLGIIAKQSDRLNAIIEDLLALSRIEQEAEQGQLAMEETRLRGVLNSALQLCQVKATAKDIRLELHCAEDLPARVNPPLLEQAVVNLLDNGIKHSESGSTVRVTGAAEAGEVLIRVQDWGCGIAAEHLPRLFERFYRVDKARSRQLGGTGLGLAIVKHIVQAHGGHVSVESTPGKGSLFTIHLRRWLL